MIVRFFKTGTSNGEAPVKYLLSTKDHTGKDREQMPEVLEGSPALTIDLINNIERKYKYASGCLAFRSDEQPSRPELLAIIDQFKRVVAPGLEADQFNALFVVHREAEDKKTGQSGFHVHFVLPMVLLGGQDKQGKDMTGKRWNPHPPGQQTIEVMRLFTQTTNHEQGWKQVQEHPKRLGINSLWRKAGDLSQKQKSELLHAEVLEAIKKRQITARADLLEFLEEGLGLTVTRATEKTVSVKFPGSPRAIKLKGAIYEAQTQHQSLKTAGGQGTLSPEEYGQVKLRLNLLLSQRAQNITNAHTTTRRRNVYGQRRTEISGAGAKQAHRRTGGAPWRETHNLERKNGLERVMFSEGRAKWSDSYDGSHQAVVQGLWGTPGQSQQAFDKAEQGGGAASQSRPRWGQSAPAINPAANLDEQIRTLSLQLNDCPAGSLESRAITDQLNWLQGEKGRLPKEPIKIPKLKPR